MKAISEYFRDLAAGDRFFGAEPPQPDADLLHRIAEQTIKAQVNAEVADNSLILRQAEPGTAQAAPAPAPVPVSEPAPAAAEITPAERFGSDTVAEKLQRIRAVVANEANRPAPYSEDEHANDTTGAQFVAPEVEADENDEEIDFSAVIDSASNEDAQAEEAARAEAEAAEKAEEEARAEAEAAEKAEEEARAEAEAAQKAEEEARAEAEAAQKAEEEARAEAEAAQKAEEEARAEAEAAEKAEEEARAEAEAAEKAEEEARAEAEAAAKAEEEADTEDDAEEDMAASEAADMHDEDNADDETEDEAEEDLRPTPRRRIVVQKISRTQLPQQTADAEDAVAELANDADALSPEAEDALMRELAELEVDAEGDTASDARDDVEEAELVSEDDADVAADDAADEATDDAIAAALETSEDDMEGEDAEALRAARLARRSIETEDEDAALERLMDVTSSRLENDESSVRRASIAHLKAAVAATKADSSLVDDAAAEEEREMDQYRDDLARVVKPGRARPSAEGSSRNRPSPLVLVSEQRVDEHPEPEAPSIAASADIRPRRISHGNLALQEDLDEDLDQEAQTGNIFGDEAVESFGEYAARHSALELPDMLEAAAAHYTWVEEQSSFTRPMLMRKIASISETHAVSREDGLRAFGTLLRQGIIVKSGNGKFAIATTSRFAPEAQSDDE